MQEPLFIPGRHVQQRRRFIELGCNLADEFVGTDALADCNFKRLPDGVADRSRDFYRRFAPVGRNVEVSFVYGSLFHVRRKIVSNIKYPLGKLFVALVVTAQHEQFRAELVRPRRRHRCINVELSGFVGGRGDDAATFTANRNRFSPQPRVR